MYKFLHKNIVFHLLIIILLLGYSFFVLFTESTYVASPDGSSIDLYIRKIWDNNILLMRIITALFLVMKLLLLQIYFERNQFFEGTNLFPSIFYLVLLAGTGSIANVSILFFVNFFLILLLLLNSGYQPQSIKNQVFISGFIIGVLFFADISSLLLFVFVIASLLVNRFSKIRDVLLTLLGFSIPIIYVSAIYLFTDQYLITEGSGFHFMPFGFYPSLTKLTVIEIVAFFFMILSLLYFGSILAFIFSSKLIIMRRRLISINALSITLFATLFFTSFAYPFSLVYMFIPITVYCSIVTQQKQNWVFNYILMIGLTVLLCL